MDSTRGLFARDVRSPAKRAKERDDTPQRRLFEVGPQALSDSELLQILLGDLKDGASIQQLISSTGSLKALCLKDPHELCACLTPKKAAQVLCAMELGRRVMRTEDRRPLLRTPEEIYAHLKARLWGRTREEFHILCFNNRNQLINCLQVAAGSVSQCPVDPKDVFQAALSTRCTAIVLAHNHPSGDPTPSASDMQLTRQLLRGGQLLCINVLDHIVFADHSFESMALRGDLERLQDELRGERWLSKGGA